LGQNPCLALLVQRVTEFNGDSHLTLMSHPEAVTEVIEFAIINGVNGS
jgi:hypothetical protein